MYSISWKVEYLFKSFESFCVEDLPLFPHLFIYLFAYLFTYLFIPSIMYLYQYGFMYVYFILQIVITLFYYRFIKTDLAFSSSSHWLLSPFTYSQHCGGPPPEFTYIRHNKILQDYIVYLFLIPAQGSTISPRSARLFYWKTVLKNKICTLGMPIATNVLLLLDPLGWPGKCMYVCVPTRA